MFKKVLTSLLPKALLIVLLLALVGCSSGKAGQQSSSEQTELDRLEAENESLRAELEEAISSLNSQKPEEEEQTDLGKAESGSVSLQSDIIPPQLSPRESLLGEWYFQEFREDGYFSWTQSMVFQANGSGTLYRTYYVPKDNTEPQKDFDESLKFSWSLDADIIHMTAENGEVGDFTFFPTDQKFTLVAEGSPQVYAREAPSIPEQYIERKTFSAAYEAQEAAKESRRRQVLGNWYFDVLVWTFNDDGTGVIDIPKLGDQPATEREFSFDVQTDSTDLTYLCLYIEWDDSRVSYYFPTFDKDGSMTLKTATDTGAIKLTRTFDIDNCPISEQIISNGIGVFSGSIFSDLLPEE